MHRIASPSRNPLHPTHIAQGFPGQRMIVLPRPVVHAALQKPITSDLTVTDVGMFPSAARHFIERRHGVPQAIIIYCVRGEGWTEIAGVRHAIPQDHVLLVPAGRPHAYGAAERRPWTIYWCHVAGRNVPAILSLFGDSRSSQIISATDGRHLVPLFEQILDLLEAGYGQHRLTVASLALGHLFGTMLANRSGLGAAGPHGADLDQRIDQTIQFMRESIGGSVSVAELAAMAKLSPSHYAAVFKRKTGFAALDFFIRLKMQEACRLLDSTSISIKEIADELGYEDALYFSRAFRKIMALPPREYRAQRKG